MNVRDEVLIRQNLEVSNILKDARVSIFGCGGLGSNIAMILARSGVGNLYLYDYDKVEFSNLNRQNFTVSDLGKYKSLETKKKIESTLPFIKCNAFNMYITKENINSILDKSDVFIEAFDNVESKSMVFDYFSSIENKKLVMGSGLSGLGTLEDIKIKVFNNVTVVGDFKSSTDEGLYFAYLNIVASTMALCAIKLLIGEENGKY